MIIVAATCSFILKQSAFAQDNNELNMTVKAGFSGKYKDGGWVPVWVRLENNGVDLQGVVRLEFTHTSNEMDVHEVPVELPSVSRKEININVFPKSYFRNLQVSFISDNKTLKKVELQVDNHAATDLWFGIISDNPTTFNILSQLGTTNSTARIIQLDLGDIPERAHVLKSMDVLILAGIDTGKLNIAQRQAIMEWTAGGGKLVLTGGTDWQKTAAGFLGTELPPLIPNRSQAVKNLDNLIKFSHTSEPLLIPEQGIMVAVGRVTEGAQVLATAENKTPLLLWKHYGAGEVLYLAFDPSQPTFRNWIGRENFFRNLFAIPLDKPSWLLGVRNWISAKEAAFTLPNLSLPSPLLICGFLGIYILALGPFNYLLVRALKRSELGWVTVSVMVICFSALIILIGSVSRGSRVILNRLAVVQVWLDVPQARVDGVMGIYSPTRSTYQVEANAPTLLHALPTDYGAPGNSYLIQHTGTQTIISGVKLEISGIEPVAFEGSISAPVFKHDLAIVLNSTSALLKGSVTNASDLTLSSAVLLYPGGDMWIGDFPPGATINLQTPLVKAQLAGELYYNPVLPYTTGYYGFPLPYSSLSDTTIEDILGTTNFYDDRKTYRKYSWLYAITNSNYSAGSSRGTGVYLAGWTDQLPIDVRLINAGFNTQDNVLYIVSLKPAFQMEQDIVKDGAFTLTPGAFSWNLLDGNDPAISPYNINTYPGMTIGFQFTPIQPVEFSRVKSLVLHLEGGTSGSNVTGISVQLWNYQLTAWEELDDLRWGDNYLGLPERYVGNDGSLRLRIPSRQTSGILITQADFTLELEK